MSRGEGGKTQDPPDPAWVIRVPDEFKARLEALTRRNPALLDAFRKKIEAVSKYPMLGKRSKLPFDTRHIPVMSHWVLVWRIEGKVVTFLDCGHHDDFYRR